MKFIHIFCFLLFLCCVQGAEAGTYEYAAQWGEMGSADDQFYYPYGIGTDSSGNVYVADTYNHRVQKFNPDGGRLATWTNGTGDLQFNAPCGLAIEAGGTVYVCDGNMQILKFAPSGMFMRKWGGFGGGAERFLSLNGIAVNDSTSRIYTVDGEDHTVKVFSSIGSLIMEWVVVDPISGLPGSPFGIALDRQGHAYVTDRDHGRVLKYTTSGTLLTSWDGSGTDEGAFISPWGIAVDPSGNVIVADEGANRIRLFTATGTQLAGWGKTGADNGAFDHPTGVAVDAARNVFVADRNNCRVQKFSPVVNSTPTNTGTTAPTTVPTTEVTTVPTTVVPRVVQGGIGVPTDLDHDGMFEDVNGNGRKDFSDAVLFFNQMSWIAANEPITLFDYNGNGRIDFADVTWLFNHL